MRMSFFAIVQAARKSVVNCPIPLLIKMPP
jgi:hypothetical protein